MLATALAAFSISLAIFPHETRAIAFFSSSPQLSPQAHEENQMRSLKSIGQKSFGVLSSLAIAAGASAQDAVQWRVEDGGNGHWYAFTDSVSGLWPACRMQAEERGGHLAQVKSQATQQFVLNLAQSTRVVGDFWIGGFQQKNSLEPGGGWIWLDGSQFKFDAWGAVSEGTGAPPSPNDWPLSTPGDEDFLEICFRPEVTPFGAWDDQGSFSNASLIEWSADCNSDGIVDYGQIRAGELEDANGNNIPDCCEQSTSCPINLIENGGFEIGPTQTDCTWVVHGAGSAFVPGWSVLQVSVDRERLSANCPITTESWRSYEGEFTIDLDGYSAGGAIRQVVATTPNAQYRLTFQLTGNCGDTSIKSMFVRIGDMEASFDHACQATNPQPWNEKVVEFVATSETTAIDFVSKMTVGGNGPVIDGVRLVQIADPCSSDIDQSGTVNAVDLAAILTVWGTDGGKYPRADINGDGEVNGPDLAAVLSNWGSCP
jgi:choice-of-anchor C domain-containing protein